MALLPRHELPAYSPLSALNVAAAIGRSVWGGREAMERATSLVAAEFAADEVLLVDSGRSALQLAIDMALSGPAGARIVALPAFQCYEVASAAVGAECRIVLYDIDPTTLQPDRDSLEQALRRGASAVVIAPLYGFPVDWTTIAALAERYGAVPIEDAAQAHGAEWNGRRLGTLGEISVMSFGRGKGWTGGRGGALLLRKPLRAAAPRSSEAKASSGSELRILATTLLQLAFGRPGLYGIPASIPSLGLGETHYHDPATPTSIASFSAALIAETVDASAQEASRRREHAAHWDRALPAALRKGVPVVLSGGAAGYLRYPVRIDATTVREVGATARRAGVARSYPRPLGELPAVAPRLIDSGTHFPGAEALARELITLPTHSRLTRRSRDAIVALSRTWKPAAITTAPSRSGP